MERHDLVMLRDTLGPGEYADKFGRLCDANWHRDWVSPIQASSHDPTGPVVMGTHWLDLVSAKADRPLLEWYGGYNPRKRFNRVLDLALWHAGLHRRDVYITQACHLLPLQKGQQHVPEELWKESYDTVTRHEIRGRPVIAFGGTARALCCHYKLRYRHFRHPGTSGPPFETQARAVAKALVWAMRRAPPSYR